MPHDPTCGCCRLQALFFRFCSCFPRFHETICVAPGFGCCCGCCRISSSACGARRCTATRPMAAKRLCRSCLRHHRVLNRRLSFSPQALRMASIKPRTAHKRKAPANVCFANGARSLQRFRLPLRSIVLFCARRSFRLTRLLLLALSFRAFRAIAARLLLFCRCKSLVSSRLHCAFALCNSDEMRFPRVCRRGFFARPA